MTAIALSGMLDRAFAFANNNMEQRSWCQLSIARPFSSPVLLVSKCRWKKGVLSTDHVTKRNGGSGDENCSSPFPLGKLSLYSACSSGGKIAFVSVWQMEDYLFCDVYPVNHILINCFEICTSYELSSRPYASHGAMRKDDDDDELSSARV